MKDSRLKEFGNRIIYDEYKTELENEKKHTMQKKIYERISEENKKVPWCTILKARKDLKDLRDNPKYSNQIDFINKIEEFINSEDTD